MSLSVDTPALSSLIISLHTPARVVLHSVRRDWGVRDREEQREREGVEPWAPLGSERMGWFWDWMGWRGCARVMTESSQAAVSERRLIERFHWWRADLGRRCPAAAPRRNLHSTLTSITLRHVYTCVCVCVSSYDTRPHVKDKNQFYKQAVHHILCPCSCFKNFFFF